MGQCTSLKAVVSSCLQIQKNISASVTVGGHSPYSFKIFFTTMKSSNFPLKKRKKELRFRCNHKTLGAEVLCIHLWCLCRVVNFLICENGTLSARTSPASCSASSLEALPATPLSTPLSLAAFSITLPLPAEQGSRGGSVPGQDAGERERWTLRVKGPTSSDTEGLESTFFCRRMQFLEENRSDIKWTAIMQASPYHPANVPQL
ncbi:uncharacterized protein LOC127056671 [Gopherus flavomarginatus]|uniref:uncharacterized protein LOC127056671 n=1 Tax=Gopherus flavomarginatus TaxID=286002 RepID=UPI0021CC3707|nr:uncharacterized protein LOC127056671 [Gopherus flavomarginatus]